MEREETPDMPRREMLKFRTLALIVTSVGLAVFIITGFSFEALFGTLFAGATSIIVYRTVFNAERQAESEAIHVIERHRNPNSFPPSGSVEVLEDIDVELQTLLGTAFTEHEVDKIERDGSPFDAPFTLSWKNFFHYLLKGKQL